MNLKSTEEFVAQMDRLACVGKMLMKRLNSGFGDVEPRDVAGAIRDGTIFELLSKRWISHCPLRPLDRLELLIEWEEMLDDINPFYFSIQQCGLTLIAGFVMQGLALRSERLNRGSLDDVEGALDDELPDLIDGD